MNEKLEKRKPLCPICLNWDPRPEEGLGHRAAYCTAKEIVTFYVYECDLYEEATEDKQLKRKQELYGSFEAENELHDE